MNYSIDTILELNFVKRLGVEYCSETQVSGYTARAFLYIDGLRGMETQQQSDSWIFQCFQEENFRDILRRRMNREERFVQSTSIQLLSDTPGLDVTTGSTTVQGVLITELKGIVRSMPHADVEILPSRSCDIKAAKPAS